MYPKQLEKLILELSKLPGIGEKTAERLAMHIATKFSLEETKSLGEVLINLPESLKFCKTCGLLTDEEICKICSNPLRNQELLMIVAKSEEVYQLEKTNSYHGIYHILGGLIDFSRGITETDLNFETLTPRLKDIKEVIIATNSTVEGEITAEYLKIILKDYPAISITRLAYGIPAGSDLKYADTLTLQKAIENRRKF